MLRVLRAETVRSGFHSLPFSRIALKKNPKALFSSLFLLFLGLGAGGVGLLTEILYFLPSTNEC